jgi:hypothetical protein
MFCLRRYVPSLLSSRSTKLTNRYSWLPLLFIPTNASPIFIFLFFLCTYFLNRPCVYCSFLLLILFASSCHWSDHCFFDFGADWFEPRRDDAALLPQNQTLNATAVDLSLYASALNNTAAALAGAAMEEAKRRLVRKVGAEWTGIGVEWLRSLLGRREWRINCVDVYIRL